MIVASLTRKDALQFSPLLSAALLIGFARRRSRQGLFGSQKQVGNLLSGKD